jgi:hypothetical protein
MKLTTFFTPFLQFSASDTPDLAAETCCFSKCWGGGGKILYPPPQKLGDYPPCPPVVSAHGEVVRFDQPIEMDNLE